MLHFWRKFNRIVTFVAGALLGFVMLTIVVDVCGRIFFNHPITGMVDTVTVTIPIFLFLPLAYVDLLDEHIRVEVLTGCLDEKKQMALDLLAAVCGIVLFIIFAWEGWELALESWRMGEYYPGVYRIRVYPTKFAIALGCSLFCIQLAIRGIMDVKALISNPER
ncbi:MAG: TRAP transporter small permease [Deltaproteobacteria bacterium]|nr:TRAP transporter small permease [Deltaproteobacteria bacterium]MBW1923790.1 TRAP transporter small permease [Deltaproteobacteria bacterium]MBW2103904.1 TRAP transporter small permease [Deltaproteobacteria bacterium]MBW2349087.1 TRAP transporter small permease [Deltaproteobacteria bacterium]